MSNCRRPAQVLRWPRQEERPLFSVGAPLKRGYSVNSRGWHYSDLIGLSLEPLAIKPTCHIRLP